MIRAVRYDDSAAGSAYESGPCEAPVRMGVPEADWSRQELFERARWENDQIGTGRCCAPRYWYLGKILLLVQENVEHGHWESWCEEHTVQRNRWQRGRHLALAFQSADDVARLTIEAADALAREILGLPPRQTAADTKLRRWVKSLEKSSQARLDEFPRVTCTDGLRPRLAELQRQLTAIEQACAALEERRASATANPRRTKRPK